MKRQQKKLRHRKKTGENRNRLKRIPVLGEWKRSWGRPSALIIIGVLLLYGIPTLGLAVCALLVYCLSNFPGWPLLFVGILTALFFVSIRFVKFATYICSFDWDPQIRADVDGQLEDVSENDVVPLSARIEPLIDDCFSSLKKHYEVDSASPGELLEVEAFFRSLHKDHPDRVPRALDVFRLRHEGKQCLYCVVEFAFESVTGKVRHRETVIAHVVQVQLPRSVGRVTMRPRETFDFIAALFTDADVSFETSAMFSQKYYCTAEEPRRAEKEVPPRALQVIAVHDRIVMQMHDAILLVGQDLPFEDAKPVDLASISFELLDCFTV